MKRILLSILVLAIGIGATFADTVRGTVSDSQGEPLIGVSVVVDGTKTGTVTDFDGNFAIDAPLNGSLTFTYIGYTPQTVKIQGRHTLTVTMKEDNKLLDEVVIVGYDTQRKANLTGAVSSVSVNDQLEGRPITNVGTGLQGATPGLTITQSTGKLGETPTFRIRGAVGTLSNEDGSQPLILVDGVELSDISLINSEDIQDISILKDAASSSIYGTRAAFGVILITTKKGNSNSKFNVKYSNNFSWSTPTVLPTMAKSYESAQMLLDAVGRRNGSTSFTQNTGLAVDANVIDKMKEWEQMFGNSDFGPEMVEGRDYETVGGQTYFYRSWNPVDEYIKKYSFSQQHNISVGGTANKTNYYLGMGYMGQDGIVKVNPDKYSRYSIDFSADTEVFKWLTVRSKLMYAHTDVSSPYVFTPSGYESRDADNYDALYYLYRWPANYPYGTVNGLPLRSAVTETEQANRSNNVKDYMRVSVGTTFRFYEDLSLDIDYTYNMDNQNKTQRGGAVYGLNFWSGKLDNTVTSWTSAAHNRIRKYQWNRNYHAGNAVLRYKHTWNDAHKFSAFAGMNIEYKEVDYVKAEKRDLLDFNKVELSLANGEQFASGSHTSWAIMGFFARANYSYKDRYLIELNGRVDGSSRFPVNKQWGFFPSGSIGWVASEENFFETLKPWWSFAKVRASYGSVGNQDIGNNLFRAIMTTTTSGWVISDINELTFTMPRTIADGFSWETIKTIDAGVDLRFLDDDLGVSFDWYRRINDGMVQTGAELPSTFGASAPMQNAAQLTTNGWELSLDYHHRFENGLRISASFNLSDALTKVTKHPRKLTSIIGSGLHYEGEIYGEIWGFETDRLFQESDFHTEIVNGKETLVPNDGIADQSYFESQNGTYKYGPGDVKYKDLDGDGVISWGNKTAENHGDMRRIGNTTPRYEYNFRIGLDWKGVDLSVFFQGVGKRDYWGTGSIVIPGYMSSDGVYYAHQTDYWTPTNTDAFYPRLTYIDQPSQFGAGSFNYISQTRFLLDMSYLRLKNITVGYNLPKVALEKIHFEKFRIYASFENVCEFDHLGDIPIDPETGRSTESGGAQGFGRIYPFSRQMSFGMQITL